MIRFIDLGKQISPNESDPDWPREFCFYDTLAASFISFDGQQIFDSVEDILGQMDDEDSAYIKRIVSLIPPWVPRGKKMMTR